MASCVSQGTPAAARRDLENWGSGYYCRGMSPSTQVYAGVSWVAGAREQRWEGTEAKL